MPYLAKMPFSLATNSGAASVSAMKPSLAPFTSGPGGLREGAGGKLRLRGAEQRGGAGAGLQKRAAADFSVAALGRHCACRPLWFETVVSTPTKKPQPEVGFFQPPQVSGVACWPVVGPDTGACAPASSGPLLSSVVPVWRRFQNKPAISMGCGVDWPIVANYFDS